MLTFLKNLGIRIKIAGFVIPSTIAFGVLMTILSLYLLKDLKETTQRELSAALAGKTELSVLSADKGGGNLAEQLARKEDEQIATATILLLSIVGVVIFLAAVGAWIISSLIARPLQGVAEGLQNISSGDADLTRRLPLTGDDETGKVSRYFNIFLEKLQSMVRKLQGEADQLAASAKVIHSSLQTIEEKAASSKTIYRRFIAQQDI